MKFLTVAETAELLQVNPEVLRRWLAAGKFPGRKGPGGWRIAEAAVARYFEGEAEDGFDLPTDAHQSRPDRASMGGDGPAAGRVTANISVFTPARRDRQAAMRRSERQARPVAQDARRSGTARPTLVDSWGIPPAMGDDA